VRSDFTIDSLCPKELHVLEKTATERASRVKVVHQLQAANDSDAGTQLIATIGNKYHVVDCLVEPHRLPFD